MSVTASQFTFESLASPPNGISKQTLDDIMLQGTPPAIADLLGYEFRGWNLNRATELTGTRKFKKGFFGQQDKGFAWGYNIPIRRSAFHEPWISKPSDQNPKRYFFFKVFPPTKAPGSKYPNSLVIDYHKWGEYFFLNPVGYTVDYLVYADPTNRNLILGKSYLEAGPVRPFLGYFVLERRNPSNYERSSHFLNRRELRTVEAFADVFIDGEEEILPAETIKWNIDRHLERIQSSRTRSLHIILFLVEHVLPRVSFLPSLLPFSRMSKTRRKRFIERRIRSPRNRGALRDLARVRTLFIAGYYGDPRTYNSINFVPVKERPKYQSSELTPLPPKEIKLHEPSSDTLECEICVIGSGAAGAVVAFSAAAQNRDVILLEEGSYIPSKAFSHDEIEMTTKLYKEGGLQSTVDMDMSILQGKCLGGSTVINNAICFRLNDPELTEENGTPILERWRGLGAEINELDLEAAYQRVENKINVTPLLKAQDPRVPPIDGNNVRVFLGGWEQIRREEGELGEGHKLASWKYGLFRKNYDRCLGCGYCAYGCPYGRKMSMLETYIPNAADLGARVIADCHAIGIEYQDGQARAVRCEMRDGRKLQVKAQKIVLSCGAIGSSVLLMKSGITKNVGSRFSFNAGTPLLALMPDKLNGYDGVQMAAYVDGLDYMLETLLGPPLAFAVTVPGWFNKHFQRMRRYDHFANGGVLIGTESNGSVNRSKLKRSILGPVSYEMTTGDLGKLKRGMAMLARTWFAAGAEAVYPATFGDVELTAERFASRPDEILPYLDDVIRRPEDLTLSSAHPQGGNPMSNKPSSGVVDSSFRVHGFQNLFVCDASVFPTSIRINPQLTIMAMADYFSRLGGL